LKNNIGRSLAHWCCN